MTQVIHCIACLDDLGVEIVYSTHSSVDPLGFTSFLYLEFFQFESPVVHL